MGQGISLNAEQEVVVGKVASKLAELGYEARFIGPISVGPILSVYRFFPTGRTKVSNLEALASDFAVTLGVEDVLVKRMPGESAVGIFVPNAERTYINFRDTASTIWQTYHAPNGPTVPLNLGIDHLGQPFVEDLALLPHLLIAGSTGAGKSTLLDALIASIVYTVNSDTIKLVMSDTKNVEFGHFVGAPHLLFEPATSIYQTLEQLDWVIDEMSDRLNALGKAGVRNIFEYREMGKKMASIVVIIDELADIMQFKGEKRGESKIAEDKLGAIVQKSRAAGVYVIAATQRPSVNVVAGSIKANFPARLTFRLPSDADSRTVIGTTGAEHLLSRGDMLYVSPNAPGIRRLHAPFVEIEDIKAAVEVAIRREGGQ